MQDGATPAARGHSEPGARFEATQRKLESTNSAPPATIATASDMPRAAIATRHTIFATVHAGEPCSTETSWRGELTTGAAP
jgi:hypothetical protein